MITMQINIQQNKPCFTVNYIAFFPTQALYLNLKSKIKKSREILLLRNRLNFTISHLVLTFT